MVRTVVAFDNEASRAKISEMLERGGVTVRYRCRTGHEAIRAIKSMGGGVVVCGAKLPDFTADTLAFELHDYAEFLVVAKPAMLELCENEEIFKIATPITGGELIGAVNMLVQMDQQRSRTQIPRRSPEEEALIRKATELLMKKDYMTEDQAHRYLQRKSMAASARMADTAKQVIEALEKE